MTLVGTPLEVLDFVTATAVASPAAETSILATDVIQSGGGIGMPAANRPAKITVTINITEGTTGTAFVLRLRQGTLVSGALVGAALTVTLAAAANFQGTFVFRDASGVINQPGGSAYNVTVAETGATANGTVNAIDIQVEQ